jgi:cytidine deaminase
MQEIELKEQNLLELAKEAASLAYAPYSGYNVGAALLGTDGNVYTGCNVENASYSLGICAERSAIFKAVSSGCRTYAAIAIYVDSEEVFPPCGACRQVMHEFNPQLPIVYGNKNGFVRSSLTVLLPGAFELGKK